MLAAGRTSACRLETIGPWIAYGQRAPFHGGRMKTPIAIDVVDQGRRARTWLGLVLLGIALLGHLLAARAIGGSYIAYRDHVMGFLVILLVSGALIVAAGRWLWKGRLDMTVLTVGIIQALFGIFVYATRFHVHGGGLATEQRGSKGSEAGLKGVRG